MFGTNASSVRITAGLLAVAFLSALLSPAVAFGGTVSRIYGADRYATAHEAAYFGRVPWSMPPQAEWAVVATGENWPDALCSGGLAGAINGGVGRPSPVGLEDIGTGQDD